MLQTTHLLSNFEELSEKNWTILKIDVPFCKELLAQAQKRLGHRQFHLAELALHKKIQADIRNDQIFWLNQEQLDLSSSEKNLLQQLDMLRSELKNFFRISLTHFESHFAYYDSGHFYQRHRDITSKNNQRVFSFVLYLNENWKAHEGGELVGSDFANAELFRVKPEIGQMILFRSDLEHEVLITQRERFSIAGWMRQ